MKHFIYILILLVLTSCNFKNNSDNKDSRVKTKDIVSDNDYKDLSVLKSETD